ncbi:MAG: hypothetical protein WD992_01550 [Candidatus Levyibacteriota bacterium]
MGLLEHLLRPRVPRRTRMELNTAVEFVARPGTEDSGEPELVKTGEVPVGVIIYRKPTIGGRWRIAQILSIDPTHMRPLSSVTIPKKEN